ncbi:MAG TPA: type II toxin-antitoxin system VapC family toxin [Bryobacteraceae bacterium]|nr:type II toxin-antitoxin system VapC family toxin [Bryobacteraceae bacterium]
MVAPERSAILVDTNILLRAIQQNNPLCSVAKKALKNLHRRNRELCLTPQNVRKFWNVCTRSTDHNGLGMSAAGAGRHVRFLERHFRILPDSALTFSTWLTLVTVHGVLGAKVHDAWLVAGMKTHGISQILTFNVGDFARYDGIDCVDPRCL